MNTRLKWILASVAIVGLLAVGVSAAAGGTEAAKHRKHPGPGAVFRVCTDDSMTVGECKELVKQKMQERIDAQYQKCLEKHDKARCDEMKQKAEERQDNFGEPRGK